MSVVFGVVVPQVDPHDSFTSFGSYQTRATPLREGSVQYLNKLMLCIWMRSEIFLVYIP